MKPTIMLVGLGELGEVLLELLARESRLGSIIVIARHEEYGVARCNLTRLSAMAQGYYPTIRFFPVDLRETEAVAEIVYREAPSLVINTTAVQSKWLPDLLPPSQAAQLKRAGFGIWLPVYLTLTLKLMEALRAAAYDGLTLTASYPDVVNCILDRLDLTPTCGIGNIAEIVPKIQLLVAERLGAPLKAVRVLLVAHHALKPAVFRKTIGEIPPYFLRVQYGGQDVTYTISSKELLLAAYPIPSEPRTHFLTAGSAIRLTRALLSDEGALLHAPGPNGLPGGYPIIASSEGVQLAPIESLALADAIAINEESHHFDGIEKIEADGTTLFRPEAAAALRETLGYDYDRLAPHESEAHAKELIDRFRAYAAQFGVQF